MIKQEMTYDEETQDLVDKLVEVEAEAALADRNFLMMLVYQHFQDEYAQRSPKEIRELAQYYDIIPEDE